MKTGDVNYCRICGGSHSNVSVQQDPVHTWVWWYYCPDTGDVADTFEEHDGFSALVLHPDHD